jgi:bifunctional non-homologous end joining protein LigD
MVYAFSLPTKADKVPAGSDWIHEIKYDGYRMMVVRDQDRVRLISRGGYDWAQRFPLIVAGALKLRQKRFVLDGEVVVLRLDGNSDFDALASRQHDNQAQFYAFDMLAGDGEDYRQQALVMRKASLAKLLKRPVDGIFIAEYEQGDEQSDIGDVLFRVACNMGLEGIVSKRLDRAYGAGKCSHWLKIKKPSASGVQQGPGRVSGARIAQVPIVPAARCSCSILARALRDEVAHVRHQHVTAEPRDQCLLAILAPRRGHRSHASLTMR